MVASATVIVATGACVHCEWLEGLQGNLPGAIVRVWKGLGTRVGADGARPGVVEGRALYVKTAYIQSGPY